MSTHSRWRFYSYWWPNKSCAMWQWWSPCHITMSHD